jgi:LmbE family N-acetylglucosaminyl deacetylase
MNIVAFGAHPDDVEVLMGGTIAKYKAKGHNTTMVLVSSGSAKNTSRLEESQEAARILGAELVFLDIDPFQLQFGRKLVGTFDEVLDKLVPDVVFTHWIGDSHNDHRAVTEAVTASSRRNSFSLLMYEQAFPGGITYSPFRPQVFVNITKHIEVKKRSVLAHKSQVADFTEQWIRGIVGRASYYGFLVGCEYAEAFEVIKLLDPI